MTCTMINFANLSHFTHDRSAVKRETELKGGEKEGSKIKGKKSDVASPRKPKIPASATEAVPAPPGQEEPDVVLEAKADLYLYDQASGLFMTQEKDIDVKVLEAGRFLCKFKCKKVHSGYIATHLIIFSYL